MHILSAVLDLCTIGLPACRSCLLPHLQEATPFKKLVLSLCQGKLEFHILTPMELYIVAQFCHTSMMNNSYTLFDSEMELMVIYAYFICSPGSVHYLPACLPASLPACLLLLSACHSCLPACHSCLPACLPALPCPTLPHPNCNNKQLPVHRLCWALVKVCNNTY